MLFLLQGTPGFIADEIVLCGSSLMGSAYFPADVYAYGVTLACMWLGKQVPYGGEWLGDRREVKLSAEAQRRPMLPETCPAEIAMLIRMCWHAMADKRPTFAQVRP
jgi:hypothetical protein